MTATLNAKVRKLLILHEGATTKPYLDTATPPRITIGVGRNLSDRGISQAEMDFLLANDIDYFSSWLIKTYPWFNTLDENRKAALIDMCFNLGTKGFSDFKNTLSCIASGDYEGASRNMLASKWASQVPSRAKELANIVKTGQI